MIINIEYRSVSIGSMNIEPSLNYDSTREGIFGMRQTSTSMQLKPTWKGEATYPAVHNCSPSQIQDLTWLRFTKCEQYPNNTLLFCGIR